MVDCRSLGTRCDTGAETARDNAALLYAAECIQLDGDELFDCTMA